MRFLTELALILGLIAGPALGFERTEERADCRQNDPLRRPFFGDTHVHTSFSFDARSQDTRNTPRDAYRFAKGEPMGIQPYDEAGKALRTVQLDRPLDWTSLSDHAELLGTVRVCSTPGMSGYYHPACMAMRNFPNLGIQVLAGRTLIAKSRWQWGLCGSDGAHCQEQRGLVWKEIQAAAEEAYDRSADCSFTSFVGYEWTGTVGEGMNLHRNVVFRNAKVPEMPTSWVDTPSARDLWDRLQEGCVDGVPGCDALTIPHNSNISGGLMFQSAKVDESTDLDLPVESEEAKIRARWEPLVEIMQHKGDSECNNLTGFSDDEACGFEKLAYDRFGAQFSDFVDVRAPDRINFTRAALGQGLLDHKRLGANPFAFGIIASTDTHIAAPGLTAEKDHPGHGGAGAGAGEGVPVGFPDTFEFNPGGLAVLWAEENSRDSLFAAMQRKEAYGTSGTRPIVRFFGGWDLPANLCDEDDFVPQGYEKGVPMGGDLSAAPAADAAPRLAVWAMQDPGTATAPGTPLQRIQIVKGWLEEGELKEKVIDVAGGPNDADVDLATCQRKGEGARTLCSVWTDPDFDAGEHAYYYSRVLENPTCRWSQYVCNAAKVDCSEPSSIPEDLARCCSEEHRPKIQERAWTSPIWFSPSAATESGPDED